MKRTSIRGETVLVLGLIPVVFFIFFYLSVYYPRYPMALWIRFLIIPMFFILSVMPVCSIVCALIFEKGEGLSKISAYTGMLLSAITLLFILPFYTYKILIWMFSNILISFFHHPI